MPWNRTYRKDIINGQEVMTLIEEVWEDDITPPAPTVEELQQQVINLETQLNEVKTQLEILTGGDIEF